MENNFLNTGRHSMSHVLAKAMLELYPDAKLAIGPPISDGLYYDFDLPNPLSTEDYKTIESKIKEIMLRKENFVRKELSKAQALELFENQPYKLELIEGIPSGESISIYETGSDFFDLCTGPHVENSKDLLSWAFKVHSITGAYWRGDASLPMLQRVYVYAFPKKDELKQYLALLEEAKKRDHRKIGPQLDLFFMDETAPGMPYWLPKGLKLFNLLLDFWRAEHEKRGYQEISAPLINSVELWKTSGHWAHYQDNMFIVPVSEEQSFAVKPMNCPNAMVVYQRKNRSYKELPLRFSDCDVLHRKEVSGTLHGLLRVQMFRQDDSHNFVSEHQIADEINAIMDIADLFYGVFGLEYRPELSTRPQEFMGDIALWDKAEAELRGILDKRYGENGYTVNEGDGAFYGPKIDIMMQDALKRVWQMGTVQLDFQLPHNFKLTYQDKDGTLKTPVVIHRVIYGSLERFIGLLIEHFAGAFPYWISPVQVGIVPIRLAHNEYAKSIKEKLLSSGIRCEINLDDDTMGTKIKKYRLEKMPYVIIVGDEEMESGTISLRIRTNKQVNNILLDSFVCGSAQMIKERALELKEDF